MKILIDACAFSIAPSAQWISWMLRLARALGQSPSLEVILLCAPDDRKMIDAMLTNDVPFGVASLDVRGALRDLGGGTGALACWNSLTKPNDGMKLLKEVLPEARLLAPDIFVTMTLGGLARTLWPDARVVYHELHPFSRDPFPQLWLFDSSFVMPVLGRRECPLSTFDVDRRLSPSAQALVGRVKNAAHRASEAISQYFQIAPLLPLERKRPLALLPLTAPQGFQEVTNSQPQAQIDFVGGLIEDAQSHCDLLVTQHPIEHLLGGSTLATLAKRGGIHSVATNPTSCAPTNILAADADVILNASSKSVFTGLLFDKPIIEFFKPRLGRSSTHATRLTSSAVAAAFRQASAPSIKRRRDNILYDLLRHYACTETALENGPFVQERLLGAKGSLGMSAWVDDKTCADAYEKAIDDTVAYTRAVNSPPPASAWKTLALDGLSSFPFWEGRDGWRIVDGQSRRLTLPSTATINALSFEVCILGAHHLYLPLFVLGQAGGSAAFNRRIALHWVRDSELLALSFSTMKSGLITLTTPRGSAPLGSPLNLEAVLSPETASVWLVLNGSMVARHRLGRADFPQPATHLAVGVDLEWESPPGAFAFANACVA